MGRMEGCARLAECAQPLGGAIEGIVTGPNSRQGLPKHVHQVTVVEHVTCTEDTCWKRQCTVTVGRAAFVLGDLAVHGGLEICVASGAEIRLVDSNDVVAEVLCHSAGLARAPAHAVGLDCKRDDVCVLLRIVALKQVADDRVEAREGLVHQLALHRTTSKGRLPARGARPSCLK